MTFINPTGRYRGWRQWRSKQFDAKARHVVPVERGGVSTSYDSYDKWDILTCTHRSKAVQQSTHKCEPAIVENRLIYSRVALEAQSNANLQTTSRVETFPECPMDTSTSEDVVPIAAINSL